MINRTIPISIFFVLLAACATSKKNGTEAIIQAMEQDPPEQYEAVLNQFLSYAQAKDIERMLDITSTITVQKYGKDSMRKLYEQDISPGLIQCGEFSKGGDYIHVSKFEAVSGSGWRFIKSCSGSQANKNVKLKFLVLNEKNKIVIASVGVQ